MSEGRACVVNCAHLVLEFEQHRASPLPRRGARVDNVLAAELTCAQAPVQVPVSRISPEQAVRLEERERARVVLDVQAEVNSVAPLVVGHGRIHTQAGDLYEAQALVRPRAHCSHTIRCRGCRVEVMLVEVLDALTRTLRAGELHCWDSQAPGERPRVVAALVARARGTLAQDETIPRRIDSYDVCAALLVCLLVLVLGSGYVHVIKCLVRETRPRQLGRPHEGFEARASLGQTGHVHVDCASEDVVPRT
mmetsp:Transcript_5289/g.14510  ORF Transcript_5289/g.14510 Transcript_5289/m.14510 type:complete len:250 (-) Transcript_5289:453-1202(-)